MEIKAESGDRFLDLWTESGMQGDVELGASFSSFRIGSVNLLWEVSYELVSNWLDASIVSVIHQVKSTERLPNKKDTRNR